MDRDEGGPIRWWPKVLQGLDGAPTRSSHLAARKTSRPRSEVLQSIGDLVLGQKYRVVTLPGLQRLGQQRSGAASDFAQSVDDPKHAMYPQAIVGSDSTEQSVAGQQDARVSWCGDGSEAVIGGEGWIALLECNGLSDFVWCQVVGDHPAIVKLAPLLVGEIEDFGLPYRQRDDKSERQIANYSQ